MIDFIYELPGGMEVFVRAEVTPDTITIHACGSICGELDPDRMWVDMQDDVGLWPLTQLLKQEASERAGL